MAAKRQQSDWRSKTLAIKKLLYEQRVTEQRRGRCKNIRQDSVRGGLKGAPRREHGRAGIACPYVEYFLDYDSVAKGTARRVLLPLSAVFIHSRRPLALAGKVNWAWNTP